LLGEVGRPICKQQRRIRERRADGDEVRRQPTPPPRLRRLFARDRRPPQPPRIDMAPALALVLAKSCKALVRLDLAALGHLVSAVERVQSPSPSSTVRRPSPRSQTRWRYRCRTSSLPSRLSTP